MDNTSENGTHPGKSMVGEVRYDEENDSLVFVVQELTERANEYVVTYNWDKSEKYVCDFDSNEDYPDDDYLVSGVYEDSLPASFNIQTVTAEAVSELAREGEIRLYPFPVSRLKEQDN